MPHLRHERVRELLKRQIGEALRREISLHEAGLLTVNSVSLSSDLQSATVYVGILGTPEQQKHGAELLRKERKRIQTLVAHSVVLKYTPQLRFVVDDSIQRGHHVLEIIDEIEQSSPPS